jgi:hypothetical protein
MLYIEPQTEAGGNSAPDDPFGVEGAWMARSIAVACVCLADTGSAVVSDYGTFLF